MTIHLSDKYPKIIRDLFRYDNNFGPSNSFKNLNFPFDYDLSKLYEEASGFDWIGPGKTKSLEKIDRILLYKSKSESNIIGIPIVQQKHDEKEEVCFNTESYPEWNNFLKNIKLLGGEEGELADLLAGWAGGSVDVSGLESETTTSNDTPEYLDSVLDADARQEILDALDKAQEQASELKGPVRRVVDQGLFHLMQRASYSEENLGHFGLNLDAYVHFTSPIRRYPDLMAHRQLKAHLRAEQWVHSLEETAKIAKHCSEQGHTAKRMEWELVANAYHLHLLRGGKIGGESSTESTPLEHTSWPARITGLRTPWIFLDLADDGAIHGRMHLRQIGGKTQMSIDEYGLAVIPAEPDARGEQEPVVQLGQKFPCRLRGLDVWAGSLDLAPQ